MTGTATAALRRRLATTRLRQDYDQFFDGHVEVDAVHEQIALHDLAGQLAGAEPDPVDDILFGAGAALAIDGLVGAKMVRAWEADQSSLRTFDTVPA